MQPLANIAVSAARAAGKVTMRHMRQSRPLEIEAKGHNDFVTRADYEAEAVIIDTIRRAYPEHAIIAEESGRSSGRRNTEVEWIIDPIDGTTNFIHQFPHFAVSIAARVRGELAHAVIYDPYKDELFTASRGDGAHLDGRRIRVSGAAQLSTALLATGFAYQRSEGMAAHFDAFREILETCSDIRRAGSAALDLAYVAAGRLDGFWEFGLKPWDMAAGLLLVREAGGVVGDPGDGDPMETGNVVAGTLKIQAQVQQIIKSASTPERVYKNNV